MFLHSALGGNDLYVQLIDQLNYSEKQSISTDHKFIMEKKFPHSVFLTLFYYKEFHDMDKALILIWPS